MSPRIRSFLRRPHYTREAKAPAREAPRVFREFVETLQRLDPPARQTPVRKRYSRRHGRAAEGASAAMSKRRELGNGHAKPRRSRPHS